MSALTDDNRHMDEQEEYLLARIEALSRRLKELELENAELRQAKMQHTGHLGAVEG